MLCLFFNGKLYAEDSTARTLPTKATDENDLYPSDSTWAVVTLRLVYQQIDHSKLVLADRRSLKEAVAKIETEARVTALEDA